MTDTYINRRNFLAGAVAVGALASAGKVFSSTTATRHPSDNESIIRRDIPTLLRGGMIVPVVGDPFIGDILIRDGIIADLGHQITATDVRVFDASRMIVIPGFVDTHRHLWQTGMRNLAYDMSLTDYLEKLYLKYTHEFRADDIYASTFLGRLAALDAGVTTVLDWAHNINRPEDAQAGIDALTDVKARSVFGIGYGAGMQIDLEKYRTIARDPKDIRLVADKLARPDSGALISTMLLGREPGHFATLEVCEQEVRLARSLGLRTSIHLNNLGVGWKYSPTVKLMHKRGLTGEDVCYIHLTETKDDEIKIIADTGGHTSVAAQIDAHMGGFGTPPTGRLLAAGIRPSISADTPIASSEDMFSLMRSLFDIERAITKSKLEPRPDGQNISVSDVLEFATLRGAHALGLGSIVGSIEKNKHADLVLINRDSPNLLPLNDPTAAVVFGAHVGNIDTVLVKGEAVKQDGRLLIDWSRASAMMERSIEKLYSNDRSVRN